MILRTVFAGGATEDDSNVQQKKRVLTFSSNSVQCSYKNEIKLEGDGAHSSSNKISISNNICKNNGEAFEKVTIIRFNNQVVTIKDEYSFLNPSFLPALSLASVAHERKLTHKKQTTQRKRITKNLAKNFIMAFLLYLDEIK